MSEANYYVDTDSDVFKQRLADELGLDLSKDNLTLTCLGDTLYRIDFSLGKYHANTVIPVMRIEQAKDVAAWIKAQIKKQKLTLSKDIVLSEDPMHHISVKNRRLNVDGSSVDAAVTEFVFRYNLKVDGLGDEEIDALWKQSPWCKEAK